MTATKDRVKKTSVSTLGRRNKYWTVCLSAVAVLAVCVAAPVTVHSLDGLVLKSAHAKSGNGGGNGGGHAGGNGAGNGGGNGGMKSKGPKSQGVEVASTSKDDGRDSLILLPVEEITIAMFTTRISKRYPANEITTLGNPHQAVSFFSEVKDMTGRQISHLWYFEGKLKFTARFNIRSNRWRVWSTQLLPVEMTGLWTVKIVDEDGTVFETRELRFVPVEGELLASR